MATLDTDLILLLARREHYAQHPEQGDLSAEETTPLFISLRFSGPISEIEAAGFITGSVIGNIAYGQTNLAGLARLANHPAIEFIQKQRLKKTSLHKSVPEIKANTKWTREGDHFSGYTGKEVFIGIIDTGIDYRHHAFRKGDTSRIYKIWDQTLIKKTGESAPVKITDTQILNGHSDVEPYGVEYSNAQISAVLAGTSGAIPVRHEDEDGHGSHVAGIAAGDGSQSGGCHGAYHYVGVAPDAKLIIVRLYGLTDMDEKRAELDATDPDHRPAPPTSNSYMIDALLYMFNEVKLATGTNKSLVVNLSLGAFSEKMDGSTSDCQSVDTLLTTNSTGRAIVFAAGNEGNEQYHAATDVPPSGPEPASVREIEFYVYPKDKKRRTLCILYSGNQLQVELQSPVKDAAGKIAWVNSRPGPAQPVQNHEKSATANGAGTGSLVTLTNIPNRIDIGIVPADKKTNKSGRWKIRLKSTSATPTPINAFVRYGTRGSPYFVTHHTSVSTLDEDSSGKECISVGSYKVGGKLAKSSSRGPTTDVPARTKPELAAPGVEIQSAGILANRRDAKDYLTCRRCCCACCEDYYVSKSGTSMAAPHVTGLIALMFHRNPTLTHTEVKTFLSNNCGDKPADTSAEDSFGWGAGKADAMKVLDAIPKINEPEPVTPFVQVEPQWSEKLYEQLMATPRGAELVEVFEAHADEVMQLINHNKRVATTWHRVRGPVWVRHALRAASTGKFPMPDEVEGISFEECCKRFISTVKQYAGELLNRTLEKYAGDLSFIQPGYTIKEMIAIIGNANQQETTVHGKQRLLQ